MDGERPGAGYLAYGLRIDSEIMLPELNMVSETWRAPDLHVRLGGDSTWQSKPLQWVFRLNLASGAPWMSCARTQLGYLVRFEDLADFTVTADGREVVCVPSPRERDDGTLRHLLLDLVLPLTFKLRGFEALHASAILTSHGVCAFIGPTGSGKSSMAAAFLKAGYPAISDDCLLVRCDEAGLQAFSSYPGVRLWDDAVEAARDEDRRFLPLGRHTTKRRWLPEGAVEAFSLEAQPLRRIYRLTRAEDSTASTPCLEPLSARGAFMELVDATFRLDTFDRAMLTREFKFWEHAALNVPMRRLRVENDLASPLAREAVLRDLGE